MALVVDTGNTRALLTINRFLKFQDSEEISSFDLADAFEQMWEKKRYHEILFMIDTCQANTMYSAFYTPNIIATGSSAKDQSSYSHHADQDIGVAVVDRWTYYNLEWLERINSTSSDTLGELFDYYTFDRVHSDAGVRYDLFPGGEEAARNRRILDFFGNVQGVEVDHGFESQSAWKHDLEVLQRFVEDQRRQANRSADVHAQAQPQPEKPAETRPKALDIAQGQTSSWTKQLLGAGVLLLIGSAWSIGGNKYFIT